MASSPGVGRMAAVIAAIAEAPIKREFQYMTNFAWPNAIPSAETLLDNWQRGMLSFDSMAKYIRYQGVKFPTEFARSNIPLAYTAGRVEIAGNAKLRTDDPWMSEIWSGWKRWDLPQIYALINRGVISERTGAVLLELYGYESYAERKSILDLRRIIPPPGQILDLALRGALDPANLTDDRLLAEYSPWYDRWARASGLTTVALPNLPDGTQGIEIDFAKALWGLHWQMPGLTDWFEMRRRLRPSIVDPNKSADPSGIIVPDSEGERIFRQNSIYPGWRKALQAISYRPISFRAVDQMIQAGTATDNDVREIMRDNGYHPYYADKLAQARIINGRIRRNKEVLSRSRMQVESAWELGSIDDQQFIASMRSLGLSQQEAQAALDLAGVEHTRKRLDRLVRTVRQQYMTGQQDYDSTKSALYAIGIIGYRVTELMDDWSLERSGRRKLLSAAANIKAAKEGLLPIPELISRLRNLDYTDVDISIFLAEIELWVAAQLSKAAEAAAKAREKGIKQAERAAKQAEAALQAARTALSRHGSPAKLKTWYCDGIISADEMRARLRFLGWPDADIDRLMEECAIAAAKKNQPKPPKSKPPAVPPPPGG
jgi:hypothetical protein